MIAYNGLVIWPTRDQGYYAEITNRQGEDIHTTDSYETEAQAVRAAREWIDQNETASRLTPVAADVSTRG